MTKEQIDNITSLTLDELKQMSVNEVVDALIDKLQSEEDKETYRNWRYLQLTDNHKALKELDQEISDRLNNLRPAWKTGIEEFDKKLDGGFLGGDLAFLGAVSSLGKTSLALQIATQIAEQGRDVIIFTLEMSKNVLNAKVISRYTFESYLRDHPKQDHRFLKLKNAKDKDMVKDWKDACLTARDVVVGNIDRDEEGAQLDNRKRKYFDGARERVERISNHVFMFRGNRDVSVDMIDKTIGRHISATNGRKPFVILDYLQILQPSAETNLTDKRLLTDYDVTTLKNIAVNYDIPILAISAFNRNSYLEGVSMSSFRESSGIEYSADILLGMQYVGMDYIKTKFTAANGSLESDWEGEQRHKSRVRDLAAKMDEYGAAGFPLPVELKILKVRLSPKNKLCLNFFPAFNYFESADYTYSEKQLRGVLGWDDWIVGDDDFRPVPAGAEVPFKDGKKVKATSGI